MERTIEDLFGIPSNTSISTSGGSFMKPPIGKKPPRLLTIENQESIREKENSPFPNCTAKAPSTANAPLQLFMKPPTSKLTANTTTTATAATTTTTTMTKIFPHCPEPKPITETKESINAIEVQTTLPAFVIKPVPIAAPQLSFKYQICLQDWYFVAIEDCKLIAIGRRVDIDEFWKSEPVAVRIDPRTFLSTSQVQYHLAGLAKPPAQLQHSVFNGGLPGNWKELL